MNIEDHRANLKESLEVIEESVEKGLVERQRTIGFSVSSASVDLLCYGKPKKIQLIQETLDEFNRLKGIFREVGLDGI